MYLYTVRNFVKEIELFNVLLREVRFEHGTFLNIVFINIITIEQKLYTVNISSIEAKLQK